MKTCHFLNFPDCSTCSNTYLCPPSHYSHNTDDDLSESSLCWEFVKEHIVISLTSIWRYLVKQISWYLIFSPSSSIYKLSDCWDVHCLSRCSLKWLWYYLLSISSPITFFKHYHITKLWSVFSSFYPFTYNQYVFVILSVKSDHTYSTFTCTQHVSHALLSTSQHTRRSHICTCSAESPIWLQ